MKKIKKLTTFITSIFLSLLVCASSIFNKTYETKAYNPTYEDDYVSAIKFIPGYNKDMTFMIITLGETDYSNITENGGNDFSLDNFAGDWTQICNFWNNQIVFNDNELTFTSMSSYLVYYANANSLGFDFTSKYHGFVEGDTIKIKAGTTIPSYGALKGNNNVIYKTTQDDVFTYSDGAFRKSVASTPVNNEVTELKIITGYNGSDKYLIIMLKESDYNLITENSGNDFRIMGNKIAFTDVSNFARNIKVNDNSINFESSNDIFMNYFGNLGGFGVRFSEYASSLKNFDTITIPEGTSFPSYKILKNEGTDVYVTTEEKVFTYYNGNFHQCASISNEFKTDSIYHWQECSICHQILGKTIHHMVEGEKAPTCTEPGYEDASYCDICGYVASSGTALPALGHDYEHSEYEYDEDSHWRHCSHECGECETPAPHTYGSDGKTCTECGFVRDVCFINISNGYFATQETNDFKTNSVVTIVANTPEEGKMFEGWYINNEKVSSESTYSFVITNDVTIEARFVESTYPEESFDDEPSDDPTSNKGCGGSLVSLSVIICLISILGITFIAKKNK